MVTYSTDELIPSSDFAKKFGSYLLQIKNQDVDKLAILKNNKVEAVLISKDEYENMKEALIYMQSQETLYSIDESLLKKVVRTTQAIEGYGEVPDEIKRKVEKLSLEYGIKVST